MIPFCDKNGLNSLTNDSEMYQGKEVTDKKNKKNEKNEKNEKWKKW